MQSFYLQITTLYKEHENIRPTYYGGCLALHRDYGFKGWKIS
jgi:hypothetical protein